MSEIIDKAKFNIKSMREATDFSYATATDLADWLVRYLKYTFRDAYKITGKIVAYAEKNNKMLNELTLKDFQKFDNKINKNIFTVLSSINSVKSKKSYGGTSPENVKKSISKAIKRYL